MNTIYFDNASTTFPKPQSVAESMYQYLTSNGCNVNRGCYEAAYETEELLYECRELINDLFHGPGPRNVVFTKNVTESINVLLKGFLKPGDHILVSSMEHNAMMRPLLQLRQNGVTFTRIPCDNLGRLQTDQLEQALRPNTKMMAVLHGSNVCGTLLPIKELGVFCRTHQIKFLVDTAQTAGIYPIDMKAMHIDALAFTGHKGLMGPQGIGGFLLTDELSSALCPLLSGGTGSISHREEIPDFLPDRFEPGTPNIPGIIGLRSALLWLKEVGPDAVRVHELALTDHFLRGILASDLKHRLKLIGLPDLSEERVGVVSILPLFMDPAALAYSLDTGYHIQTRVGLHCAPAAHKTLGTYPTGTVRFSFGYFNTRQEVDMALKALDEITVPGLV